MNNQMQQWSLARRPQGNLTIDDFKEVSLDIPEPGEDEVLIRNTFISMEPVMREAFGDFDSFLPPLELGQTIPGGAVGIVEKKGSNVNMLQIGDPVYSPAGWSTHSVFSEATAMKIASNDFPNEYILSVLGYSGLTAYRALTEYASLVAGETVFVSGAAGSVGNLVGQFARKLGAGYVIGSAGSPEKVRWLLEEAGFDAAFNYKDGDVKELLKQAAPNGIDVYVDNVGYDHLEAAIDCMNLNGRIAISGMISGYESTTPLPGPSNLVEFVPKNLRMQGVGFPQDYAAATQKLIDAVAPWLNAGEIIVKQTIVEGFEKTPEAFIGLFSGKNIGKMLVKI
ncbi:hypothetical protein SAMN05444487_11245 [Marininema mesophilum]|uniref:Enoyl reductase (ER) domain-containing protein n=1 Tax=Marininema mesophilum TaxID=1048340 RepID=A0A1H2ZWW3_9BACL|nr:NADP-dependent oxidoreductase [Marininema mesophilum]SDX22102.1 hypothetical protein SAMN05444487_11245 [Marininema mesophilum]